MPNLFSPLELRGLTLKNRISVSPMCQYSAEDGFANDWHLVHLGTRAVGGAGLVISEAAAVEPRGRISPQDLGIWKDEHVEKLRQVTAFIHSQGAAAGIQLAHAGRKASTYRPWSDRHGAVPREEGGWNTVGPDERPFQDGYPAPIELGEAELPSIVHAFQVAAERALEANFDVIEVHAAHGYLLHSFLSPLSNQRDDRYGGSFENRIRLLCEVVGAVRQVWPSTHPLFVRLSASDWHERGWTANDTVRLARSLEHLGVDLIDCSSGGIFPGISIPIEAGYQVPFAERIKLETGLRAGAVGLITEAEQANAIIEKDLADLVFLARELLRNPYWPLQAAKTLGLTGENTWPPQYRRAV